MQKFDCRLLSSGGMRSGGESGNLKGEVGALVVVVGGGVGWWGLDRPLYRSSELCVSGWRRGRGLSARS